MPITITGSSVHEAIESALASMQRPVLVVTLELEDAGAIASIEGCETLRALDEVWRARIRALIPEQAFLLAKGPGEAIALLPGSTPQPRTLLAALGGTGQPAERIGTIDMRIRAALGVVELAAGEAPSIEQTLARSKQAPGSRAMVRSHASMSTTQPTPRARSMTCNSPPCCSMRWKLENFGWCINRR